MNWLIVGDTAFAAGTLISAGLLAYGGWLVVTALHLSPPPVTSHVGATFLEVEKS